MTIKIGVFMAEYEFNLAEAGNKGSELRLETTRESLVNRLRGRYVRPIDCDETASGVLTITHMTSLEHEVVERGLTALPIVTRKSFKEVPLALSKVEFSRKTASVREAEWAIGRLSSDVNYHREASIPLDEQGKLIKAEPKPAFLRSYAGNLLSVMQLAQTGRLEDTAGQAPSYTKEIAANAGRMSDEILETILPELWLVHGIDIVVLEGRLKSDLLSHD